MEKVRARCGQRSDSRTAKEQNRTFTRRHVCSDTDRPSAAISPHVAVDFCTTRSSAAVDGVDAAWTSAEVVDLRTVTRLKYVKS